MQCYPSHSELWTLSERLPNGEDKIRYRSEEAMPGTKSLESEGKATVKVDAAKPRGLSLEGLPWGSELREGVYELTGRATDGEGSTVPSSGIKSLSLFVDGTEMGKAGGTCSGAKGECGQQMDHQRLRTRRRPPRDRVAFDKAGNEAREPFSISIRHSTPVALGPGSVDLESGDFSLGANDVSLGSA